jgi:hypothetical protein
LAKAVREPLDYPQNTGKSLLTGSVLCKKKSLWKKDGVVFIARATISYAVNINLNIQLWIWGYPRRHAS